MREASTCEYRNERGKMQAWRNWQTRLIFYRWQRFESPDAKGLVRPWGFDSLRLHYASFHDCFNILGYSY